MRWVLVTLSLITAGCGRRSPSAPVRLQAVLETLRQQPPCDAVVAVEWAHGFPVPDETPGAYKVFYYPLRGAPSRQPVVHTPVVEALLDLAAGKPLTCRAIAGTPRELRGPRWPDGVAEAGMKAFDARSAELLSRTQALGELYPARKDSSQAKAEAARFIAAFDGLAEPALRHDYYRLNPAFWEWVRGAAGRSLAKP